MLFESSDEEVDAIFASTPDSLLATPGVSQPQSRESTSTSSFSEATGKNGSATFLVVDWV